MALNSTRTTRPRRAYGGRPLAPAPPVAIGLSRLRTGAMSQLNAKSGRSSQERVAYVIARPTRLPITTSRNVRNALRRFTRLPSRRSGPRAGAHEAPQRGQEYGIVPVGFLTVRSNPDERGDGRSPGDRARAGRTRPSSSGHARPCVIPTLCGPALVGFGGRVSRWRRQPPSCPPRERVGRDAASSARPTDDLTLVHDPAVLKNPVS